RLQRGSSGFLTRALRLLRCFARFSAERALTAVLHCPRAFLVKSAAILSRRSLAQMDTNLCVRNRLGYP
ncbi:MAG: hypothetical protein WAN40_00100, partial [Thermoplasmata archaeon]